MKIFRRPILYVGSLFLVILLSYQNCSNVRLAKLDPASVLKQTAINGAVCTRSPGQLDVLERTIFIVDMTGSMAGIDPGPTSRRVKGLRKLIDDYKAKNDDNFTISIGALYGNSTGFLPDPTGGTNPLLQGGCTFYKPRIAGDYAQLNAALNQLDMMSAQTFGNTPYATFFSNVQNCITSDLSANSSSVYNVVLVTDGAPTDLVPSDVYARTRTLIQSGKSNPNDPNQVSRVNLFMYFLDNISNSADEAILTNGMISSAQGAGGYRSAYTIDTGGAIDYQNTLGFLTIRRILKQVFVTNMNAAVSTVTGLLQGDSDGDGISDEDETRLGYNPTKYNSRGDCSDLIYRRFGRCPSSCSPEQIYTDSDHDGLSDCDEINLGTNRYNFDTDGDTIPDGLEVRIGSNPLDFTDVSADVDNDRASTLDEARRQTSIFIDDTKVPHPAMTKVSVMQVDDKGSERCYQIQVDGLQLFPVSDVSQNTVIDIQHGKNQNVVKVMFEQVPEGIPNATPTLLYAYKILPTGPVGTILNNYTDLNDQDFELYNPTP